MHTPVWHASGGCLSVPVAQVAAQNTNRPIALEVKVRLSGSIKTKKEGTQKPKLLVKVHQGMNVSNESLIMCPKLECWDSSLRIELKLTCILEEQMQYTYLDKLGNGNDELLFSEETFVPHGNPLCCRVRDVHNRFFCYFRLFLQPIWKYGQQIQLCSLVLPSTFSNF